MGGRRYWPDEVKVAIVAETYADGVSVAEVARRHDINANLLFIWRRDKRFNPRLDEPAFLPIEVSSPLSAVAAMPEPAPGEVQIHFSSGVHMVCQEAISGQYWSALSGFCSAPHDPGSGFDQGLAGGG